MLPEEVTKFIGQPGGDSILLEVEKGAIRRFADAVEDPNLLYQDEKYARNSRYGAIVAPPGFFGWPAKLPTKQGMQPSYLRPDLREAMTKAGYSAGTTIDGGTEYEFYNPIRAGDTITVSSVIKDIVEREGKTKIVFTTTEITYTNQNGDVVAKVRQTSIQR